MKFFKNVETLEDLRNQYKKLVFIHHPDKGGKVEDMQALNNEYDELYKVYKNKRKSADGTIYTKKADTAEDAPTNLLKSLTILLNLISRLKLSASGFGCSMRTNAKRF